MKRLSVGLAVVLLSSLALSAAEEAKPSQPQEMKMPQPQKEHEWMKQLNGEWDTESEMIMDPAKPPEKAKGTESNRMLGGFWVISENKGDMMGSPFAGILTLGYDPEKKKYVGTWVDSMTSILWQYTGSVDAAGKALTLETEGPCPQQPGKLIKCRETIEIKDKDTKVFTSTFEQDGKWVTMLTVKYTRKK